VHTVTVGQTPEGITISPDGRFVATTLVNGSNKPAGSPFLGQGMVRTYRVENMRLLPAGEGRIGAWSQGVAFSADSRRLVTQSMQDRNMQVFAVAADGGLTAGETISLPAGGAALRMVER